MRPYRCLAGLLTAATIATLAPAQPALAAPPRPAPVVRVAAVGPVPAIHAQEHGGGSRRHHRRHVRVLHPRYHIGQKYGFPMLYIHYSWSDEWYLYLLTRNNSEVSKDALSSACGDIASWSGKAACVFLIRRSYNAFARELRWGIRHHRCLAARASIVPAGAWLNRIYSGRCYR